MRGVVVALLVLSACKTAPTESEKPPAAEAEKPPTSEAKNSAATSGETRGTPDPPPEGEPTRCEQAFDNVMAAVKAGDAKLQTLNKMAADRAGFLERCKTEPETVVECLATSKTPHRCSELQPGAAPPKASLEDLCREALDRSMALLEREGVPDGTLERMKDQREDALRECMREDEALVRCLAAAQSTSGLRACRLKAKGIGEDPEHTALCNAAFDRMLAVIEPGVDMPQKAVDSMKGQREKFTVGCRTANRSVAECMTKAADFAAFQACGGK